MLKESLKILFVVHGFPPEGGAGTEIYTYTIAKALREKGHDVAVLYRVADPEIGGRRSEVGGRRSEIGGQRSGVPEYCVESGEYEGIRVYRINNNRRYTSFRETYLNRAVEEPFRRVLLRERPDVVHFQHCQDLSMSLPGLCRDEGFPVVMTLHDLSFICMSSLMVRPDGALCSVEKSGPACIGCTVRRTPAIRVGQALFSRLPGFTGAVVRGYGRLAERFPFVRFRALDDARALLDRPAVARECLGKATRLIALSRFLRDRYIEFGVDPEQIVYQRNGIDAGDLGNVVKTPQSGPLRVGFIGSFARHKGLHVLLEAFRGIDAGQARLTVYGKPGGSPEAGRYADECRRLAEGRPVRFAGWLSREDLPAAHADMDLLVVPSLCYENSPLVILESQAARTPVVASDQGGMAELVEDGVTGFLFPAGDAEALRRCLLHLAADPSRLTTVSASVRAPKDVATDVEELEHIYRSAA